MIPTSFLKVPARQSRSEKFGTKLAESTVDICTFSTTKCLRRAWISKGEAPYGDQTRLLLDMASLVQHNVLHRLISSKDVAARLGVSQATVSRAAARGWLRPALVTPGGHRRFNVADVEAYAAGLAGGPDGARLITTGEAARLLGVSQPTLNRAVRRGRLRPALTTPGGHRRFDSAALSAALFVDEAHL